MASPDRYQLEQKERSLKLKEDALARQAKQQQMTEERLKTHQDTVAKKERANQLKAQDLIKRERKHQEDSLLLERERRSLEESKQAIEQTRNRSMTFILPLLLIAGIVAGYFTFEQMSAKQKQFDQIAKASENIDKLASILSLTQDEVIDKSSALNSKKDELERTQNMLADLKSTTDHLRSEIGQLKTNQSTSELEKSKLLQSAETLQTQLKDLKNQLEDQYLNIDIIEAVVAYQHKTFNQELKNKDDKLNETETSLSEHLNQQERLEQELKQHAEKIAILDTDLMSQQQNIQKLEEQLKQSKLEKEQALKENKKLKADLEQAVSKASKVTQLEGKKRVEDNHLVKNERQESQ